MSFIAVSSIVRTSVGEQLILVEDREFNEISAIRPSGEVVGFVVSFGIEGCLNKGLVYSAVADGRKLACKVVLRSGDVVILSLEERGYIPLRAANTLESRYY